MADMPKWRRSPAELVRLFREAMEALPEAEQRQMFGYPCAFTNQQMFAGLFQESMFLRLPEADRTILLSGGAWLPFEPMPGRPMREYLVVPDSLLETNQDLEEWLGKAYAYARSIPPRPPAARGRKLPRQRAR